MFTKKQQPKKTPVKEDEYLFSVKAREGVRGGSHESSVSRMSPFLGALLFFSGGFVLLFSGVYALTVWWRIIPQFEFWGFIVSVVLFPITIPLSPIYLGVEGDWGPAAVILSGWVLGYLLMVTGNRFYKLFGGAPPRR